ncbi:HAD-IA family hydrolase [Brucepastera parasyntrophica]|uniref:HAD family hydrolase n=1 Tax=Brucepastera parasyntrophica TaxID=2880008 RepID=UPI002109F10F|nr:HAD-IA family hydrolase [Brucepastera parasyntrophica]ULQ58890.1 HAD-IA family hydrolase [Brucepastera parasyntrophica]
MDYDGYIPDRFMLYIFDLDGTLLDSLADLTLSVNILLRRCELPPVGSETVRRCVGTGARNLLFRAFIFSAKQAVAEMSSDDLYRLDNCLSEIIWSDVLDDPDPLTANERADRYPLFDTLITQMLPGYQTIYLQHCTDNTSFYPGIRSWLDTLLTRGKTLAVLSNKPDAAAKKIISALKADGLFSVIMGPDRIQTLKPDPAGIFSIMTETEIPADKTLMIGDSAIDIATGKNAGVAACGITGGLGSEAELTGVNPDIVIRRRE